MIRFEEADAALFPGFERRVVQVDGNDILTLTAGEGPPVLMLHGDPQTHLCWHETAPDLVPDHTVILTDLRGRGESHAPKADAQGAAYAKRVHAAEQVAVMKALGHERFAVVGHDRGARVARRMALDHAERITHLAVLDVVPVLDLYEGYTAEMAQDYFYFNFLTQPAEVTEPLIAGDAEAFMRAILFGLPGARPDYDPCALEVYLKSAACEAQVAAMCACFRAGYFIDRAHDWADRDSGRTIDCSTLVVWGENGAMGRHFDVAAVWRRWCSDATFLPLPCGHFIPEEAPGETLAALRELLVRAPARASVA